MNHWRSQHFLTEGKALGIPAEALANADATAKALGHVSPQLPPLFTLRHLAHEAEVPYNFLRAVVSRSTQIEPYRIFKLKKKIGRARADTLQVYLRAPPVTGPCTTVDTQPHPL